MRKKVIAAGHICLDITPAFADRGNRISEILTPGSLIEAGAADLHTGGSVANTGLAMQLFGADVRLMGKTGRDGFGDMIRGILETYGADTSCMLQGDGSTSYSVVLAFPGIDRIFLHHPGANDTFRASDVPDEVLDDAALFHFGYPPHMAQMYRDGGWELTALMKRVHDRGCAVSLDMAAVDEHSESGGADWDGILKRTLPYVDFFVPSAEELCYMTDRERLAEWRRAAAGQDVTEILDPVRDVGPLAGTCLQYGAKAVLIKCGRKGLYLRTADKSVMEQVTDRLGLDPSAWAGVERYERSFEPEKVVSATGAGDVSIAAFLTSVLYGGTPAEAAAYAAAAGAYCVQAYDALSGLVSFEKMKKKMDSGWKKTDI